MTTFTPEFIAAFTAKKRKEIEQEKLIQELKTKIEIIQKTLDDNNINPRP